MTYSLGVEVVGALAQTVSGFEQMQQYLRLTIQNQALHVWCLDHDATTHFQALFALDKNKEQEDAISLTLYLSCETLQQSLQSLQGRIQIKPSPTHHHWDIEDCRGSRFQWSTEYCASPKVFLGTLLRSSDVQVPILTTDFLLYVQQLSVCESPVEVSIRSPASVRLCASGELISVEIETFGAGATTSPCLASAVVGLKYLRALLPSLLLSHTLQLFVRDREAVILQATLPSQILYIVLKGHPSV